MPLNCDVGEDSWESHGLQPVHPKGYQSWVFTGRTDGEAETLNTLATWCEELTHLKRPWCWERFKAGEGDDRGWDGWMASPTQWRWIWVNSGSWWWTGKPGVLRFMGSQRVGHDWVTELNWISIQYHCLIYTPYSNLISCLLHVLNCNLLFFLIQDPVQGHAFRWLVTSLWTF